jgi:hypothetical protein
MSEVGPSPYRVPRDARFRSLQLLYDESQEPNSTVDTEKLKEDFSTFAFWTIAKETDMTSKLPADKTMVNAALYGARLR